MCECYWSIKNTQSIYEKKKKSSFQRKKKRMDGKARKQVSIDQEEKKMWAED